MSGSVLRYVWRHRRPGRRPVALMLLVTAVLAGVLGMHGLAAVPPGSGAGAASVAAQATEHHAGAQQTGGDHRTGERPKGTSRVAGPTIPVLPVLHADGASGDTGGGDSGAGDSHADGHHDSPGAVDRVGGSDGCHHGMPEHADPECVSAAPPGGASVPAPDAAPFVMAQGSTGQRPAAAARQAEVRAPDLSELQILRM